MEPDNTEALDTELDDAYDKFVDEGALEDDSVRTAKEPAAEPAVDAENEPEKSAKPAEKEPAKEPAKEAATKDDISEAARKLASAKVPKVAPKEEKPAAATEPLAADDKEVMLLPPGQDGKTRQVDTRVAPTSWRKESAAEFAALPFNVRQEIHKREDDMHRGLSQYKEAADFGKSVYSELAPYEAMLRAQNTNPQMAIRELMSTAHTLRGGSAEQKAALMLQIGNHYGVDWNVAATLAQRQQGQPGQQPAAQPVADPRVDQIIARDQQREHYEAQRLEAEAQSKAATFFNDPKNEFASILREDMARLIETGQASDLDSAYDKASWINPAVRAKLVARQAEERARQDAAKAADAKKANRVNVNRRGTSTSSAPKSTVDEQLNDAYDRLLGS